MPFWLSGMLVGFHIVFFGTDSLSPLFGNQRQVCDERLGNRDELLVHVDDASRGQDPKFTQSDLRTNACVAIGAHNYFDLSRAYAQNLG